MSRANKITQQSPSIAEFDHRALYKHSGDHEVKQLMKAAWEQACTERVQSFESAHTRKSYERSWIEWLAFLESQHGIEFPWMVAGEQIRDWIAFMQSTGSALSPDPKPYSVSTINNRIAAVSSIYAYIGRKTVTIQEAEVPLFVSAAGRLRENPFTEKTVKRPRQRHYQNAKAIHPNIMNALLEEMRAKRKPQLSDLRDHAFLLTAYYTGWRAQEMISLKWGQICQEDYTANSKGTGRKELPANCYHAILTYLAADKRYGPDAATPITADDYIWRPVSSRGVGNLFQVDSGKLDAGRHITASSAREILHRRLRHFFAQQLMTTTEKTYQEVLPEAGKLASQYSLQSLRHSFALRLRKLNVDVRRALRILSLEDETSTLHYLKSLHDPVEDLQELLASVSQIIVE